MKRQNFLRNTLCLLLALVCNVVWADITQQWTTAPSPWGTTDATEYPEGVGTVLETTGGKVRLAETRVTAATDGDVTVQFTWDGGSHKLNVIGVDLVDANGTVVASDYRHLTTGGNRNTITYTLTGVKAGDYTLRYFVCHAGNEGDSVTNTNGNIKVTGLDEWVEKKSYTITIQDALTTIKIGDKTYSNGQTCQVAGTVKKSDITVVAPDGKFAAVSINDANLTINVYFATLPTQAASATYTNAVLYPAQQTAVGKAKSELEDNVYTLSNNVLAASFAKMGNAIYFAGSKAMDLVAGTEPFTVAFGDGDVVPASAMTLTSVELQDLTANANAVGGAEHYAGKALVANYTYTYNDSTINIVWRAVLRDGSHYLRTEMELTGVNGGVDMFNIIPMIYNVDTKAAGSAPATVGNTRGKVIMSNKIFAGLETPTAYNTVGDANEDENKWNLLETPVTENLAADAWTDVDIANVPMRIQEVGGSDRTYSTYTTGTLALKKGQKVTTTLTYKSGSKRFDIDGTVLLDGTGAIAASDYHHGYSGSAKENNTYTFIVPNDGDFTVCMYVDKREGDIVSTSEFKVEVYEAKEGVVINTDIVAIQGRWSRNTTLPKDETWKVGAVVGLIAQDGTQDNANIHTTQKRRSFLAYSERERAVPWRAVPAYVAWYELQINRNNAAPGREHLDNTKAEDVLDVMDHWKSDMYDRYGIAPSMFVIDDGWDLYGEWTFHAAFPNELRDMASAAKEMGSGIGAWLGPVGGYGASGNYRRQYWSDKGGMQLSNPRYYKAFKDAAFNLVCNQDGTEGYQPGSDNYVFFKFDGISGQFSSVGPDDGDVGNENAEGIIRLERYVREELREDIFFNTTVGTWASPFWYQISDATWRQENDHDRIGDNTTNRERWITYRDNLVHQNYVDASPICPINTLMTHGFILTEFGPPATDERDYLSVRNELRAAFLCGSGIVELYNDYDLTNSINGGALWADIAECIAWQKRNADVLPDIHWVGGDPWTGSKSEVYGWAAWNGTKSTLALRNGANDTQTFTFTLREALNIPANVSGSIILRSAFGDQATLTGLTEGTAINIDTELTVTLPGSSIYAFEGIDATATVTPVSNIGLTVENNLAEIRADETLVLRAAINADATFPAIAWSSSNPEVATVQGGLIVPVKAGEVTITATAKDGSGKTASKTLKINAVPVEPPFSTEEAPEYWWINFCNGGAMLADQGAGSNVQTAAKAYNDNQLWQLVGNESSFYMKNKAGRYLSWSGSRFQTTENADSKATLILHESSNAHAAEAGCYEIQLQGGSYMNQNGGAGTGKQLGTWNAGDANNHLVFVSTAPVYPEFDNEEAWYYIQFGNGGWVIEDKGAGNNVLTANLDDLPTKIWRVTGTKENCQIINKEGRYLVYEDSRIKAKTTADPQGFKLVATGNYSYAPRLEIQHNSTAGKSFNMHQGAGSSKAIALHEANDGGNPLAFVPIESVVFPEFVMATSNATAPAEKLTLWYTQSAPATGVGNTWMEYSLPIGNGQFGASLFGGVAKDEILFNEKTLWSGGPNEYGYYLPFGSVYIEDISGAFTFNPTKPVQNYYRDLNLKTATGTVTYEDLDGVKYTKQYIASNPDKAVVTKITASEAGKLSFRITMESGKPTVNAETTYENGYAQFSGKLQTVSYNATLKVVAEGGTLTTGDDGITVEEADEVLIVLMGCTDFVGNDASHVNGRADLLGEDNKAIVDAVAQKGWNAVYADHVADHQDYFCRVDFQLDGVENDLPTNELITAYNAASGARNLMLEQLYYNYGRYLSIASSRGVDSPANLQGIWNNTCTPPWHSDIHANINVQMNYWPVEAGNLSEMHLPFLNYIINEAAQPEWRAKATEKGATREDSWTILTENNIFGGFSGFAADALINNAWYVTHMWQHYRYTLDNGYLLHAFPAMKGASLFWADRLVYNETDGTYECPNEYSPEHGPGQENATAHAQQIVWECIDNTIKAAEKLGAVDAGLISQEDYDLLLDRRTNMDRGLRTEVYDGEWGIDRIPANVNILREWKTSTYKVGEFNHRHMSHLMALYPFGQLTPADGELFEAAINSMKLRGDESTGWSMGWKINLWARALMPERSHAVLRKALKHSTSYGTNQGAGGIYYNLFDSHAPFQIDGNFGAASGVQEMLMQSHTEVIDILPALPAEWSTGSIKGLKAVGDFTVDIEWEGNQARKVTITNNQGQPCYVKCVGLSAAEITVNGTAYTLGEEMEHGGLPCYQIASNAGDKIVIDLSNAIQTDKSALKNLIAETKNLVNECYDHYKTEVALQTTNSEAAYYVSTNAQSSKEGPIANLVDGDNGTYFHSAYSGETIADGLNHHITVNLGEGNAVSSFRFKYVTRNGASTNFPAEIKVWGGVQGAEEVDYELLATLTSGLPQAGGQEYTSPLIEGSKEYTHLRFMVNKFFHMAELDILLRSEEYVNNYPDAVHVPAAVEAATAAITTAEAAVESAQTVVEYSASLAALQAKYDELAAAIASGTLPVLVSLDTDKPFVYKIGSKRGDTKVLAYDLGATNMVAVADYAEGNVLQGWYFTKGSAEGKVFIHPYVGGGDVLSAKSTSNAAAAVWAAVKGAETHQEWTISVVNSENGTYNIKAGDGSNYFSNNGGVSNKMGFWSGSNTSDGGSLFTFARIDFADGVWENTLTEFVNRVCTKESYPDGNTLGYYQGGAAYNEARAAAVALLADEATAESNFKEAYIALRSANGAVVFLAPEVGKFYRLKGKYSGNYMNAVSNKAKFDMASEANRDAMGSVFYLTENNKLLSYKLGTYLYETYSIGNIGEANGNAISFNPSESGNGGYFTLKTNYSGSKYIYDGETIVNRNGSYAANRCEWAVEEVTSLPVTISSVGYATLYAPVALKVPGGVVAYTGTLNDDNTMLTLTEVEDVIPAGIGVLLEGNGGTYNFAITTTDATATSSLVGSAETAALTSVTTGVPYTLQQYENSVAFMQYTGTNLYGFKSYLVLPANTSAQAIRITRGDDDEVTGIHDSEFTIQNSQLIYDLQGRRVVAPTKGVYIVNGKKVVLR